MATNKTDVTVSADAGDPAFEDMYVANADEPTMHLREISERLPEHRQGDRETNADGREVLAVPLRHSRRERRGGWCGR